MPDRLDCDTSSRSVNESRSSMPTTDEVIDMRKVFTSADVYCVDAYQLLPFVQLRPRMEKMAMAAEAENLNLATDALDSAPDINDVRLDWLPSLPITRKRQVPAVAAIAFFYSEASDSVFHFFETHNLRESLATYSRQQAAALGKDPDSRIGWLELDRDTDRSRLLQQLQAQYLA